MISPQKLAVTIALFSLASYALACAVDRWLKLVKWVVMAWKGKIE